MVRRLIKNEHQKGGLIALGPLRWNLIKIDKKWADELTRLARDADEEMRSLKDRHKEQRRNLAKRTRASREAVKASYPLNGRLSNMKASYDNLLRLGRTDDADKIRRRLDPLLQKFWTTVLKDAGFIDHVKREKEFLFETQQAELASSSLAFRRNTQRAHQARDLEVKFQRRRNPTSSNDIWSIWYAAKHGETSRLSQILASANAEVDARDPDSAWTALHFASRQGKLGALELLLQHKAFIGARGPEERTPLHLAAGWGTYEVCLLLLQAGADKNVCDREGLTPLDLSHSRRRDKIEALLRSWTPIGLTATQMMQIQHSREAEPERPWEREANPRIKAQLRILDIKKAECGKNHPGTIITLEKLAHLYRDVGRLQDAQQCLEQVLALFRVQTESKQRSVPRDAIQLVNGVGQHSSPSTCAVSIAAALGNLGIVLYEIGDSERASEALERSLRTLSPANTSRLSSYENILGSDNCDAEHERMMQSVTRNLGLIYLAEGRVDEARPLLRACLETCERELQPDMPGGHESVELILPLMLMSYADMLAGDHVAAAAGAERARVIAANRRKYEVGSANTDKLDPMLPPEEMTYALSDPIPRLEWIGVQQFVSGKYGDAAAFFTRARKLLVQRLEGSRAARREGFAHGRNNQEDYSGDDNGLTVQDSFKGFVVAHEAHERQVDRAQAKMFDVNVELPTEFHSEAMRLDRCASVAICRQGPEAF